MFGVEGTVWRTRRQVRLTDQQFSEKRISGRESPLWWAPLSSMRGHSLCGGDFPSSSRHAVRTRVEVKSISTQWIDSFSHSGTGKQGIVIPLGVRGAFAMASRRFVLSAGRGRWASCERDFLRGPSHRGIYIWIALGGGRSFDVRVATAMALAEVTRILLPWFAVCCRKYPW